MKLRLLTVGFIAQLLLCQSVFAQQRGGGVRVVRTNADGSEQQVQLYEGSYALVIGNSEYSLGWERLSGVKSDVVAVRAILEKHAFRVEVEENLTSEQFERRIRKFINDYGYDRDNRLIVYYAGHSYTLNSAGDKRELGYIIPSDTPLPTRDARGFRQKAVSMYTIQTFAKEIQAKHALFVFDSCFSGRLFTLRDSLKLSPFIVDKVNYPVRQFITAGDETQTVPDESIFRKAFVRGLEGDANRNNDAYITGTELADFLKEVVTNYTNRRLTPQYGTINDIDLDRGDFVFVVPSSISMALISPNGTTSNIYIYSSEFKEVASKFLKYFSVSAYSEELALVRAIEPNKGFSYGFVDKAGNEIIPLKYTYASDFSEGLAHVVIDGKGGESLHGFIDKSGRIVIPLQFEQAESFSNGLAKVAMSDFSEVSEEFVPLKYGYINKNGKWAIPLKFSDATSFSEGLAAVFNGKKWGFIDKTGRLIIPYKYDVAYPFSNGVASISVGNICGLIDKKGVTKKLFKNYDGPCHEISEGMIQIDTGHKSGYMNSEGEIVIPFKYDSTFGFSNGVAWVWLGSKSGFIDKAGKEVIPIKYETSWCRAFQNLGIFGVTMNGKKGFVDIYGNEYFAF